MSLFKVSNTNEKPPKTLVIFSVITRKIQLSFGTWYNYVPIGQISNIKKNKFFLILKPVKATLGKSVLKQYSTDRKPSIRQQHHKITAETTTAFVTVTTGFST